MASSPLVGDVKNVGNLNSIKINKFQWVKRHTNKFEMRRLFLLNSHESYKNGKWMKIPEKAKEKKLNQVGMMLLFLLHQLPTKRSWHRQQLTHEKRKKNPRNEEELKRNCYYYFLSSQYCCCCCCCFFHSRSQASRLF